MQEKAQELDIATPTGSPPPEGFGTTALTPLSKKHLQPLQELQHQNSTRQVEPPAPYRPTAPIPDSLPSGLQQQPKRTIPTTPPAPTLSHILLEDLTDTARLLALFEQAHPQGLIGKSDHDRLTFVALAEHAKVVGSQNPCGLFAALVQRQHWHFVTDSDEDAAHARLKHHLYGAPARAAPPPAAACPELSQDAAIVRYLHTELARAGFQGDVFGLVSRDDASWTRERWDRAAAEWAHVQATWHHTQVLTRLGALPGMEHSMDPWEDAEGEHGGRV
jgi:hypothetical protein